MGTLLQDLVYSLRLLGRRPGATFAVVLCLAIGIGANTAIFSVVDAALLRSLPYPDPDRLVVVRDLYRSDGEESETPASAPNFLAWVERNRVFSHLAAINFRNYSLTAGGAEAEHLRGVRVSRSLFPMLGVQPRRGRLFTDDEDRPGAPLVALVGDGLWRRRFGADPGLVGRTITLNGEAYQVVGILPPEFRFPDGVDVWMPARFDPANLPAWHDLYVVARLKSGTGLKQAQADLGNIAAQLARERPDSNAGWGVRLLPLREVLVGDVRPALLLLLGAVAFVLAIACANVANLELVRASDRDREVAVRAALGAGRGRLLRQFLAESVLLALIGGGAGLLLAAASLRPLVALSPVEVSALREVSLDAGVLAFTLGISVLTGLLFGLVPAIKGSRPDLTGLLKEGTRGSGGPGGRQFRAFLVTAETGLALVLLVGAGLMLRSLWHLGEVPPGFDSRNLLTARIHLAGTYTRPEQRAAFFHRLVEEASALPGVRGAAVTTTLPLAEENITDILTVEGRPVPAGEISMANSRMITPDYFRVMKIPVRAGRVFTEGDHATAPPVAIISESMARRYWPGLDPVGKRAKKGGPTSDSPWITVVGVVGDVKDTGLSLEPGPTWYRPFAQNAWFGANLVVRTAGAPLDVTPAVRRAVRAIDPGQAVYDVAAMEDLIAASLAKPRFTAYLLLIFSGVAVLLAAVGLYAVLSYSVRQRLQEIGIRMALGARPADVLSLVVLQGMALVAAGMLLGIAAAGLLARLLRAQLFGISPTDPLTYGLLTLGLAAVALIANLLPAWRAARVAPVVSLKSGG